MHPQIEALDLMLSVTVFCSATHPSAAHFVGGVKAQVRFKRRRNATKNAEARAWGESSWWRMAEA